MYVLHCTHVFLCMQVLQNLCCQDAFESGFGFAEFSDVTGTLSQCIATVSVLFIDVNDTVVACLSPSSKETRQYKIKRVHLERASHGMVSMFLKSMLSEKAWLRITDPIS